MEFINMTSTGKATIEVDVKEFNQMVLDSKQLLLLSSGDYDVEHWSGYWDALYPDDIDDYTERFEIDGKCYFGFEAYKKQIEQANNFKE